MSLKTDNLRIEVSFLTPKRNKRKNYIGDRGKKSTILKDCSLFDDPLKVSLITYAAGIYTLVKKN